MDKEILTSSRPKKADYSQIPLEDQDNGYIRDATLPKSLKRRVSIALIYLIVGSVIGASLVFLAKTVKPHPKILTCGTTSDEARARGCIMEPMVYGWMPKECYYSDLSSEYNPYEDREWYTTPTFEELVPSEELWAGKRDMVYTHQYHTEHCFFLMRKLSRAIDRKEKYLDHKSLEVDHVDHCSEVMTRERESPNSTNDVVLGFYRCIPLLWA